VQQSRIALSSLALALPVAVATLAVQTSWPPFVFEHVTVLLVVVFAVAGGRGPALLAAVAASTGDNLLLREPAGRPAINWLPDVIDFGLFLSVALIVGWLVEGLRAAQARAMDGAARANRAREERDRLVATITHDLATPLGVIQGSLQVFRAHGAMAADIGRLLARVETAAARATSLVRTLAETQSIEQQSLPLALRPVDLRTIVEQVANMLDQTSDRHSMLLSVDGAALVINADAERLEGVVQNLVTNAIKYSPNGGRIEITAKEDAGWAMLTVRDQGIGLPPEATSRIFDFGYRAPAAVKLAPGLGLGLYNASEVVRRHGGTIAATNMASGGAIFTVRLPLAAPLSGRTRGRPRELAATGSSEPAH
jgi:signal transduction histidine kinase